MQPVLLRVAAFDIELKTKATLVASLIDKSKLLLKHYLSHLVKIKISNSITNNNKFCPINN